MYASVVCVYVYEREEEEREKFSALVFFPLIHETATTLPNLQGVPM